MVPSLPATAKVDQRDGPEDHCERQRRRQHVPGDVLTDDRTSHLPSRIGVADGTGPGADRQANSEKEGERERCASFHDASDDTTD
jgi:hypothetical protein